MKRIAPHSWPAYTLIEMMAVMLIIALVVGVAMTQGSMVSPMLQSDKVAGEIAMHLRSARSKAIVAGKVVRLEIYPEDHVMECYWEDPAAEWDNEGMDEETPFSRYEWDDNIILERAIIGADQALDQQTVVLRFWPTGVCTPVRLHLRHAKKPKIIRTVRLNPLTGLTKILKTHETPEHYELQIKIPGRRN